MLYIEHQPGGGGVIVKSNAFGSLSIVGNTAALVGKATYNAVGNYTFVATGVDNSSTGGTSEFGIQVTDRYKSG